MTWWPWSNGKTTTMNKSDKKNDTDGKKDDHHPSEKQKACAHQCLYFTLYLPFYLLRYGSLALASTWAGMSALKYLTTSSDNPELEKHYQDCSSSMMWMATATAVHCSVEFLHKKSVIKGLEFTAACFAFGGVQGYFINGIRNEPNSFVERLQASAQNLTHGLL